jgi:transcriptional regulator with XRE-family HTH domain
LVIKRIDQAIANGYNRCMSKTTGERLRDWRVRVGFTQSELAKKLEISQAFIAQLEKGGKDPGLKLAVGISDISAGELPAEMWVSGQSEAP